MHVTIVAMADHRWGAIDTPWLTPVDMKHVGDVAVVYVSPKTV